MRTIVYTIQKRSRSLNVTTHSSSTQIKNLIQRVFGEPTHQITVDARGLNCPHPITQLKIALTNHAVVDETILVLAVGPASTDDTRSLCKQLSHEFIKVETAKMAGELVYKIYVTKRTG